MDVIKTNNALSFSGRYSNNNYYPQSQKTQDTSGKTLVSLTALGTLGLSVAAFMVAGKNEKANETAIALKDNIVKKAKDIGKGALIVANGAKRKASSAFSSIKQGTLNFAEKHSKKTPKENIDISSGLAKTAKGKLFTGLTQTIDETSGNVTKTFYKKGKLIETQINDEVVQKITYAKKGQKVIKDYSAGTLSKIQYFGKKDKIMSQIEYDADNFVAKIFDKNGSTIREITKYKEPFTPQPAGDTIAIIDYFENGMIKKTIGTVDLGKKSSIATMRPEDFKIATNKVVAYKTPDNSQIKNFKIEGISDKNYNAILMNNDVNNPTVHNLSISVSKDGKISFNQEINGTRYNEVVAGGEQKRIPEQILVAKGQCTYDTKTKTFDNLEDFRQGIDKESFKSLINELYAEMEQIGSKDAVKEIKHALKKMKI